MRERRGERIEHHATLFAEDHQAGRPQHSQAVGHGVFGDPERQREITDAQSLNGGKREENPGADRIGQESEQARQSASIVDRDQISPGSSDFLGVDRMFVIGVRGNRF